MCSALEGASVLRKSIGLILLSIDITLYGSINLFTISKPGALIMHCTAFADFHVYIYM